MTMNPTDDEHKPSTDSSSSNDVDEINNICIAQDEKQASREECHLNNDQVYSIEKRKPPPTPPVGTKGIEGKIDPDEPLASGTIDCHADIKNALGDVETGICPGAGKTPTIARLEMPARIDSEYKTVTYTNNIDANNNTVENSLSSNDEGMTPKQQQDILRTTPGAFAINNPLSNSNSGTGRQVPPLEQRRSYRTSMGSFISDSGESSLEDLNLSYRSAYSDREQQPDSSTTISVVETTMPPETPFVTAVCVENELDIYEGKIVRDQGDEVRDKRTKAFLRWFFGIILVLLLAMAIALGTVLSKKDDEQPLMGVGTNSNGKFTDHNGYLDTGESSLSSYSNSNKTHSSLDEQTTEERKDYLVSLLGPISGPAGARVFNRYGGKDYSIDRFEALNWLVEDMADVDSIPEWRIFQRYVLALLFFSTNGESWDFESNFLSKDNECLWNEIPPSSWQTKDRVLGTASETLGVTCDEDGRAQRLTLRWNALSGTLPHELACFSDSLEEVDFGVGEMVGTIPSSFGQLTNLKVLGLDDHCLTGEIPESLSTQLVNLERLNIINNANLHGSMNGFCETGTSGGYRDGVLSVARDCNNNTDDGDDALELECDCCICCDHDNFDCHDPLSGDVWKSYNLDVHMLFMQTVKSFAKKECRSQKSRLWILEECPCIVPINVTTDAENLENNTGVPPFECTNDYNPNTHECLPEGSRLSASLWYWI